MVKNYRKKPVIVEAIQFNGNSNKSEVEKFVGKELKAELESETAYIAGKGAPIFSLLIETKEGIMKAMQNDYIIKEAFPTGDRDFYPCKPEIFEQTYEDESIQKKYTEEEALDIFVTTIRLEKTIDVVDLINKHIKKKQIEIWGE